MFEGENGMEEYLAMRGRSVAIIKGLESSQWKCQKNISWTEKMKTKNNRLLSSLGVEREEDIEEGNKVKVNIISPHRV